MASSSRPSRVTWEGMEPPLRETWSQVVQELVKTQQEQERETLITGLQANPRDQIYTSNRGDRTTGGPGGKSKKRRGWFKWLRKLKAREKNIPAQFYPDLESNVGSMEKLTLGETMEKNPIYEPTAHDGNAAMDGSKWMDWREATQK
uniref:Rev protein n=1 Tax=Small ruminant lentivirus TaxID=254355 RepID=A0A1P8NVS1_CAEV|nr:rev protein [Small ruminant lentivirus]QPZ85469.1 rev protein [Small ruminant lentivirus]